MGPRVTANMPANHQPPLAAQAQRRGRLSAASSSSSRSEPERTATFMITLNTNHRPTTDAEANAIADDLNRSVRAAFMNSDNIYGDPVGTGILKYRIDGRPLRSLISTLDFAGVQSEIAPVTGFLHAHAVFVVKHHVGGKGVHLSREAIQAAVRAAGSNPYVTALPYVHISGFPTFESLRKYIMKGHFSEEAKQHWARDAAAHVDAENNTLLRTDLG